MELDPDHIAALIDRAFDEDVGPGAGPGDVSAALIPADRRGSARIVTREAARLCGREFAERAFRRMDPDVQCTWHARDGDAVDAGAVLCELSGAARGLLTAERTALNFLQLLSATATATAHAMAALAGTRTRLLDTRKTIPGLRLAQKYAVTCGGGTNHRIGLFDAYLIKENHIAACGGIRPCVERARAAHPELQVEVEVESFAELDAALAAGADIVMLDNFDVDATRRAVAHVDGRALIEASGGLDLDDLARVAQTGVDYISMGALTKHVRAIDLSMRLSIDQAP